MANEREEAEQLFFQHAGWSYDPATETADQGKERCARELAHAEAWGKRAGVTFTWENDWSVDHQKEYDCYEDGGPSTCEGCVAWLSGEVVASLWCIDDATAEYRRVVEAELASEVQYAAEQTAERVLSDALVAS